MCQFKLVFDSGQHTEYITAGIFVNRTRIWWKEILNGIISDFGNFGRKLDLVGEMVVITVFDKRNRT